MLNIILMFEVVCYILLKESGYKWKNRILYFLNGIYFIFYCIIVIFFFY